MHANEQIAELFGLAKRCPHGEPESACPLIDIRKQPMPRRYESLNALSQELVNTILDYHNRCSDERDYAVFH